MWDNHNWFSLDEPPKPFRERGYVIPRCMDFPGKAILRKAAHSQSASATTNWTLAGIKRSGHCTKIPLYTLNSSKENLEDSQLSPEKILGPGSTGWVSKMHREMLPLWRTHPAFPLAFPCNAFTFLELQRAAFPKCNCTKNMVRCTRNAPVRFSHRLY